MAPFLTGRGWGWVGLFAAEAVSRFPGPPLEDPPTSPPHWLTGARGGSAVGRLAHGLPPPPGRRSVAAAVPAPPGTASAAQPPPRARAAAALRPTCHRAQRMARRSSRCEHLSALRHSAARLRAWRVTGVAIWPAPHRAQRPASRSVRQAGLVHAQREGNRARDPRARERAAACLSRLCRPDRVASGMEARQGRDAGTPAARRAARQPGPAQRGDAQAHQDLHAPAAAHRPRSNRSISTWRANDTSPGGIAMHPTGPGDHYLELERQRRRWHRPRSADHRLRSPTRRSARTARRRSIRLNRRALVGAKGAEHTAVARLRTQHHFAALALVEPLAGVGRHRFLLRMAALRTGHDRLKNDRAHLTDPGSRTKGTPRRPWPARVPLARSSRDRTPRSPACS